MFTLILTLFFINVKVGEGIIYYVNETEYKRMPPLYKLDDYDACMGEQSGVYCLVDGVLSSKQDSELFDFIQEYSADYLHHFNHTQVHRGVCYSECSSFTKPWNISTEIGLQKCINESIYKDYNLEVRVSEIQYCISADNKPPLDTLDLVAVFIYVTLIVLNLWGTLYDHWLQKKNEKDTKGNQFILMFSMRRNWQKLTQETQTKDPRMEFFKAIHGLRAMTLCCVIFSHTVLIMAFSYIENPHYVEIGYDDPLKQLLYNGSLVTQTFFVLSAFLLCYNFLMHMEKKPFTIWDYPRGILNRWLRLTPIYLLIILTLQTWMPRLGDGAQWQHLIGREKDACRKYWWLHILYINNYFKEDVHCMPQTWYLAADMQLFLWGLAVCMLAAWSKKHVIIWSIAVVAALLPPFIHTYLYDLDAVVIQTPESCRTLYTTVRDTVFRTVYIQGHTNGNGFTIALAAAALFYFAQRKNFAFKGNKLFLTVFYLSFPLGVLVILSGGIWYTREPISLIPRVLYATFYKPVFVVLLITLFFGIFAGIENVYRGIISARHWRVLGRVSYCGFLVHTLVQRPIFGITTQPVQMNDYHILLLLAASVVVTFILAILLAVTVEMPMSHLQRFLVNPSTSRSKPVTLNQMENGTSVTNGHIQSKL